MASIVHLHFLLFLFYRLSYHVSLIFYLYSSSYVTVKSLAFVKMGESEGCRFTCYKYSVFAQH